MHDVFLDKKVVVHHLHHHHSCTTTSADARIAYLPAGWVNRCHAVEWRRQRQNRDRIDRICLVSHPSMQNQRLSQLVVGRECRKGYHVGNVSKWEVGSAFAIKETSRMCNVLHSNHVAACYYSPIPSPLNTTQSTSSHPIMLNRTIKSANPNTVVHLCPCCSPTKSVIVSWSIHIICRVHRGTLRDTLLQQRVTIAPQYDLISNKIHPIRHVPNVLAYSHLVAFSHRR